MEQTPTVQRAMTTTDPSKTQERPPAALAEDGGQHLEANGHASDTRRHIRGSTLLLLGRFISLGLNFAVQVLVVRTLTKSDFGAFAYALSIVHIGASVSQFGLDKAIARYVPIYQERDDVPRMFGTLLLSLGLILGIGAAFVMVIYAFQGFITSAIATDPLSVSVLLVVVALAPVQALDHWFQGLFAVFASAHAIFFRRHLLGPSLKLAAILFVLLTQGSVYWLAAGYLIGGVLGVASYAVMFAGLLRQSGLWERFSLSNVVFPAREVLGFSVPLLSTDVLYILKTNMVVVFLESFGGTVDVAAFRAILPVAGLNLVVMQSFKYLYTPLASRLYARDDSAGLNDLYWRTATWISLMTFPIFAVSFSLAQPVTVLLFGEQYADSGRLLALVALGNYFNAAFGFNTYTLRVYGKVRYIVVIDILSAVASLGLSLFLIPRYGALGAAISVTAALIIYNVLNHAGLLLGTGIDLFQPRFLRVYAGIAVAAAGLFLVDHFLSPPIIASIALVALVSAGLIWLNRSVMNVADMFPELLRIPIVRNLITL